MVLGLVSSRAPEASIVIFPRDTDEFANSEYDMCSTKDEPNHNETERGPNEDIDEVKQADQIANLEQAIVDFKANQVSFLGILVSLREDVKAVGKGKMEAMTALDDGLTGTHTTLCRTIDMVQEVQTQLDETQDKLAHLEDSVGGINLAEVAANVSQLLTSTKDIDGEIKTLSPIVADLNCRVNDDASRIARTLGDMDALSAQMAGFDQAKVFADIDNRFHDVCEKVRRVEQQVHEMTGLREKVANQEANILAQDEKINALEQKLERFTTYLDKKVEAVEEEVGTIPKIRSRLIDLDDCTNNHSVDIKRLRDDHDGSYANVNRKFDEVDSLCVRLGEDVEKCARNTQATDDTVFRHYEETAKVKDKIEEIRKGQADTSYAIEKASSNAANNVADMTMKITKLDNRIEEIAGNPEDVASSMELHIMHAVHREASSLDEKLAQFAEGYDRSVKDCYTRFDQVYERLSKQERFEDSAMKKITRLEKQSEIVPHLQTKVTKLDVSINSALSNLDAKRRQERTRVNAKITLIQSETTTLSEKVDNLNGAIGVAKKKLVELDQEGPAMIPKPIFHVWKDFQSVEMRSYSGFEEFKRAFVFYAKAAGVPEHAWNAEMHSRMSY